MAVYTEVSDDALNAFLDLYDLGDVVSFKGIAEGVENSNFLLRTSRGQFILTLYEKRVNADDLPFFVGLMEHLAERGVTCPQPVRNRAGEALGRLAGWPPLLHAAEEGADSVAPLLREQTAAELTLLQARWPVGLPGGVIHADLFNDNVFFLGERLSGLIDFYFACNDALAYDLAICLSAWCFEPDNSF